MKFKKPKFWDLKKPNLTSLILSPLTIFFVINNYFLSLKSKTKNKRIKTICVGNIYLGGTGKTPTTIKLYNILNDIKFNVVTGKKFYSTQLDERIILKKYTKLISGKTRKKIVEEAILNQQKIVIFDDGLQDKSISYDLEIVCFDMLNFVGNGCLIPSGPLREKLNSLKKYDCVFLKSDSDITSTQLDLIKKYNSKIEIFESYFKIYNLDNFDLSKKYLIFSGIGNSKSFKNILIKNRFKILEEIVFPDHYKYKKDEIEKIIERAKNINAQIVTTEKDFVKISNLGFDSINFIEIKLKIKNEKKLLDFLKTKIYE